MAASVITSPIKYKKENGLPLLVFIKGLGNLTQELPVQLSKHLVEPLANTPIHQFTSNTVCVVQSSAYRKVITVRSDGRVSSLVLLLRVQTADLEILITILMQNQ